jgi:hypothetical protein
MAKKFCLDKKIRFTVEKLRGMPKTFQLAQEMENGVG